MSRSFTSEWKMYLYLEFWLRADWGLPGWGAALLEGPGPAARWAWANLLSWQQKRPAASSAEWKDGIKGRDYHSSLSSHYTTEKTASAFCSLPLSPVKDRPCQTAGKFRRRLPGQLDLEHVPWEGRLRERSCSVRGRRGYRGQNSSQHLRRLLRKTETDSFVR